MSKKEKVENNNEDKMPKKKHRVLKIITLVLLVVILVPLLIVGSYVIYVIAQYHRVGNVDLTVNSKSNVEQVNVNEELKVTSYNIGFGAYSNDYTFFLDEGYDSNGNVVHGTYAKGKSKEEVLNNTNGAIKASLDLNSDFYLFQEVDIASTRSYDVNQKQMLEEAFDAFDSTFAVNYDSAYLFYPFNDPIGSSYSGIDTFSKYKINSSNRVEYTISTGFSKFFDLDRCFSVNRLSTSNGKELVLVNSHMSAYDEGGLIRNQQIKELNEFLVAEVNKGNYVVCGGDFNHDLLTNNPNYPEYTLENFAYKDRIQQHKPDWINYMFDENGKSVFDENLAIYAANNEPTCRDACEVYKDDYTFVTTVDGFIASNNVKVSSVITTRVNDETAFRYTDHQPTTLTFELI